LKDKDKMRINEQTEDACGGIITYLGNALYRHTDRFGEEHYDSECQLVFHDIVDAKKHIEKCPECQKYMKGEEQ
jgi:hypothetical protein